MASNNNNNKKWIEKMEKKKKNKQQMNQLGEWIYKHPNFSYALHRNKGSLGKKI